MYLFIKSVNDHEAGMHLINKFESNPTKEEIAAFVGEEAAETLLEFNPAWMGLEKELYILILTSDESFLR